MHSHSRMRAVPLTTAQGTRCLNNCPGLPVCPRKACGQINLWGRGASGYKLILLSGLLSRAENQHSQAHKRTYSHKNTHWWCRIPTLCPPPSVGPGAGWVEDGWWHHSPSRSGLRLRLWVNGGLIGTSIKRTRMLSHTLLIFPSAKLPRHRGKHTQTRHCFTSSLFRESRGCGPRSCLIVDAALRWPCVELTCLADPCASVCVMCASVCAQCV